MANRRDLKKEIKSTTNEIIEHGYIEAINGNKKEQDKIDQLVDEIVNYRLDLLNKVNDYPRNSKRNEKKIHFKNIKGELEKYNSDYSKKIGHVS